MAPLEERMVTRRQKPKQVVWAGIAYTGTSQLIFVHDGVKVQGPSIEWIARNFPDFISVDLFPDFISVDLTPQRPGHWPANSSDLDPLDYSIREILESVPCAKPHSTVEALKRDLKESLE
ncbi:hypothetical protein ANCDUO_17594 [Ancylostoma duodenale]|uniref:Uncharacterized protein n=1 Tax=Ancylostoma duodenale TaxID=51022 RepID=A0A0C2FUM0_9BILA|nr:hypothetical protein ANCDUO_17594 [Ancylostoma duodenale]